MPFRVSTEQLAFLVNDVSLVIIAIIHIYLSLLPELTGKTSINSSLITQLLTIPNHCFKVQFFESPPCVTRYKCICFTSIIENNIKRFDRFLYSYDSFLGAERVLSR